MLTNWYVYYLLLVLPRDFFSYIFWWRHHCHCCHGDHLTISSSHLSQLWLIVVATPYPITPHIPTNGRMINSGFWMRDRNALSSPICKSTVDTVGDGSVILQWRNIEYLQIIKGDDFKVWFLLYLVWLCRSNTYAIGIYRCFVRKYIRNNQHHSTINRWNIRQHKTIDRLNHQTQTSHL